MKDYYCKVCKHQTDDKGFCELCHLQTGRISPVFPTPKKQVKGYGTQHVETSDGEVIPFADEVEMARAGFKFDGDEYIPDGDGISHPYCANGAPEDDWKDWHSNWSGKGNSIAVNTDVDGQMSFASYGSGSQTYSFSGKSYTYVPPPPKEKTRKARTWRDHTYWFVGDVHGNIEEYLAALKDIREIDPNAITIQVGDIEIGDNKLPPLDKRDFFIQGNHDNIVACANHPNFMGKFGYRHGVFFMGGAKSKGLGFPNEELTEKELQEAIKLFAHVKPEIVVTHDCPLSIRQELKIGWDKPTDSRTQNALEQMWDIHNPHVWAFGHYHTGAQEIIDGCDFICVSPLKTHQIRLGWVTGVTEWHKSSKPMEMTKEKAINHWLTKLNPFKAK